MSQDLIPDISVSEIPNFIYESHKIDTKLNIHLQGPPGIGKTEAVFQGAELVNVSLENADLSGANLQGAKLVNETLDGALTTGAIWTNGRRR